MQPDPELVGETRAWLVRAKQDLAAAAFELGAKPPFCADFVFHAQQASEKTMKAFLTWHGTPFRKTHLLEELGEQCLRIDSTLREVVDIAVPLSQYAWRFRYPGDPLEPPVAEARAALETARGMYDAFVARLPEDVRP